jgi:cation transport regulator ChaB
MKRNQLTGWPPSILKVIDRHLQDMFDAIFVSAFQRLHRAKERENLFNGGHGGLVIGF